MYVLYGGKGRQPGNAAPWPSTFSTSTLNGTNGFQINVYPPSQGTFTIGDFNGDGYGDIVFGQSTAGGNKAFGSISSGTQPTAGQYITLNGGNWTFVCSTCTPVGDQTQIQATMATTWTQLASDLNASADPNISVASYAGGSNYLAITYKTYGTAGNNYTISKGTYASATVGNMFGGTGTAGAR